MNYDQLLKKSKRILKGNIYDVTKYKWGNYHMISPGVGHFSGIWNWDSAFHAIGMIPYDIKIAKEQILGFLQFQCENGMLPDVVFENGEIADVCSKPPLMAYASERAYRACGDKSFLSAVYPKLCKEIWFWENKRQTDGMFHYDADKSKAFDNEQYLTSVKYETGWDNSPRWDNFPQTIWAIDLNCYMVMAYRAMAEMAKVQNIDSFLWKSKADSLAEKINSRLWNKDLASYTDYDFYSNTYSDVLTPASFMPLFAEIATKEQAVAMKNIAIKHFMPGMPTVAYTNNEYDDQSEDAYWRGPCWLNVAYFAAKGLKKYGFDEVADKIKETILMWVANDGESIHENYNATTGKGLRSDHFSWSCVFVHEFIENF